MNKRNRIPFGTITITDNSKKLILEALETGRISCGKYVAIFEKKMAELVGTQKAVAVSSGTDANTLALAVLYDFGANRGDEVILPALSFVATGNSVLQAGFTPVFVDVDRTTLNIDPLKIEAVITEKTRAIMPVHLMGKPAEMDTINEIAKKYGLYVVEDAAEAHGAVYKGKNAGALGDLAAFSLYVAHIVTTGEGGIITTDNPEVAEILRSLRSHGRACKCERCVLNTESAYCSKRFATEDGGDIRFVFERIGFSTKMNELEAAIGIGALEVYDDILSKRRKNLYYLMDQMKRYEPFLTTIEKKSYEEIGPHALPIVITDKASFNRNSLMNFMEEHGIDTRTLFSSMPTQCKGFRSFGHRIGAFPNAEFIGEKGIHIGVHQGIDRNDCDYVIEVLDDFMARQGVVL